MDLDDHNYYKKPPKFNKPIYGLLLGLIFPIISFLLYYFYKTKGDMSLLTWFNLLIKYNLFMTILSLSVLPNIILFFLFKKLDYWYTIKGVITAIFIYTMIVLVLRFT